MNREGLRADLAVSFKILLGYSSVHSVIISILSMFELSRENCSGGIDLYDSAYRPKIHLSRA